MSFVYHERPGVYADYDVSSVRTALSGTKVIAVAAESLLPAKVYTYTDYAGAYKLGDNSQLGNMLRLLYENGAHKVLAFPVEVDTVATYTAALAELFRAGEPDILVLGSESEEVQLLAKQWMEDLTESRRECVCFVGMENATLQKAVQRAAALNSERMVLLGQNVTLSGQLLSTGGWMAAAALAGQVAAQDDPALPLHGLPLEGLSDTDLLLSENDIDTLVQGGVTPVECVGGNVSVIRAVTTRTTTDGVPDVALRELNTVLIADEVIPGLRDMLRLKFSRCKNNATTRSAILHQLVLALEQYVRDEVIDSYCDLRVTADENDGTICRVEFGFTVTHGMGRIYLTAHITV